MVPRSLCTVHCPTVHSPLTTGEPTAMFHAIAPLTSKPTQINHRPALRNPAVARCQIAWKRAYRTGMKLTKSRMLARKEAREAFRQALPPLSGLDDIGDFIACVAFAMAAGILVDGEDVQILCAAQLALKTLVLRSKRNGERPVGYPPPLPPLPLQNTAAENNGVNAPTPETKGLATVKRNQKRAKSSLFSAKIHPLRTKMRPIPPAKTHIHA